MVSRSFFEIVPANLPRLYIRLAQIVLYSRVYIARIGDLALPQHNGPGTHSLHSQKVMTYEEDRFARRAYVLLSV